MGLVKTHGRDPMFHSNLPRPEQCAGDSSGTVRRALFHDTEYEYTMLGHSRRVMDIRRTSKVGRWADYLPNACRNDDALASQRSQRTKFLPGVP